MLLIFRGAVIGEGCLLERALISKTLLLEGHLLESGHLLDHLQYVISNKKLETQPQFLKTDGILLTYPQTT